MKIELKNLKIAASLSEETTAYTATIYVDGVATFAASNHGHGGCDMYHRLATAKVTESEVNAWVAANVAPLDMSAYGMDSKPADLEILVGRLIARVEGEKMLKRYLKKSIVVCDGGKGVRTFSFKGVKEITAAHIAAFKKSKPEFANKVVNGCAPTDALYIAAIDSINGGE